MRDSARAGLVRGWAGAVCGLAALWWCPGLGLESGGLLGGPTGSRSQRPQVGACIPVLGVSLLTETCFLSIAKAVNETFGHCSLNIDSNSEVCVPEVYSSVLAGSSY